MKFRNLTGQRARLAKMALAYGMDYGIAENGYFFKLRRNGKYAFIWINSYPNPKQGYKFYFTINGNEYWSNLLIDTIIEINKRI